MEDLAIPRAGQALQPKHRTDAVPVWIDPADCGVRNFDVPAFRQEYHPRNDEDLLPPKIELVLLVSIRPAPEELVLFLDLVEWVRC